MGPDCGGCFGGRRSFFAEKMLRSAL